MAEPTPKSPALAQFLETHYGRTTAIEEGRCVRPPIGCSGPATEFHDELSAREYTISGLCQQCQDDLFGGGDAA